MSPNFQSVDLAAIARLRRLELSLEAAESFAACRRDKSTDIRSLSLNVSLRGSRDDLGRYELQNDVHTV